MCERAPRYERGGPFQVFSSLFELLRYIALFYLNANLYRVSALHVRYTSSFLFLLLFIRLSSFFYQHQSGFQNRLKISSLCS